MIAAVKHPGVLVQTLSTHQYCLGRQFLPPLCPPMNSSLVLLTVDLRRETLACARESCKSVAHTKGFIVISLSVLSCALAAIFTGWPCLGTIATVLPFFNL